jgi:hypothetical protein
MLLLPLNNRYLAIEMTFMSISDAGGQKFAMLLKVEPDMH